MPSLSSELFSGLLSYCGWNPKPFSYNVLRDILHSRPLWYPHQPRSHGSTPTSVTLAPLLPQTHQVPPALPSDTAGSSCPSGLFTLLFWPDKVAPPPVHLRPLTWFIVVYFPLQGVSMYDIYYICLFSFPFIPSQSSQRHLFPPKVKLYKDTPATVFTAKSSGLGTVSGGIHTTSTEKSALRYLNLIFCFEICD